MRSTSHAELSSGQTCLVFNHREMQCVWKAWLQRPQEIVQPVPSFIFAWHSIHSSIMWFRQIAQLSTTISHVHNATALNFLITKRGSASAIAAAFETVFSFFSLECGAVPAAAMIFRFFSGVISTSTSPRHPAVSPESILGPLGR